MRKLVYRTKPKKLRTRRQGFNPVNGQGIHPRATPSKGCAKIMCFGNITRFPRRDSGSYLGVNEGSRTGQVNILRQEVGVFSLGHGELISLQRRLRGVTYSSVSLELMLNCRFNETRAIALCGKGWWRREQQPITSSL